MCRALALLVVLVGGCVKSDAVPCGERLCPANTTCDVERGRCLVEGELMACAGKIDGDPCEFGDVAGACYMGLCEHSTCGDMIVGPGELCDDGNLSSSDGCRADCRSDERCGNGVIDFQVGEECDCGAEGASAAMGCDATNSMTNELATCRDDCKLRCGDLTVQPGEVCDGSAPYDRTCIDYGFDTGVLACSDVCAPSFVGCTQFGWVPVDPGIATVDLRAIWGADANNIFAVGTLGVIVKWNGVQWTRMMVPPATSHLYAIWGRSATDVYAVGEGGSVMHYDGAAWTALTTGLGTGYSFRAVTGDATNVYVAGGLFPPTANNGIVARFNNNQWTTVLPTGTASIVDAMTINTARSELIVAGHGGDIHRAPLGSSSWTDITGVATAKWLDGFSAGTDVYLAGDTGLVRSVNGGPFNEVGSFDNLTAIWGSTASNIFVFGDRAHHFDGAFWSPASLGFVANAGVWGTAVDNVWAVGTSIRHFEGTTWVESSTGIGTDLNAIAAGIPGVVAVGDQGKIRRYVGGIWESNNWYASCGGTFDEDLVGVSAGTDLVVAVSTRGTLLFSDSIDYKAYNCGVPSQTPLRDVWAIDSTHDAFAVGDGSGVYRRALVATFDEWTAMPAIVWNGATPVPLPILTTIWGFSETDIFAGGNNGVVVHWNGATWTQMATGIVNEITDIWGPAPNDLFVVGSLGAIYHYDGTAWTKMTSNTTNRLEAVWGTSGTDVFATGGDTLLHYDGTSWLPVRDATLSSIHDIVGHGPRLFGVGTSGGAELLLRY